MNLDILRDLLPTESVSQDAQDIIDRTISILRETIENLENIKVPRRYLPMRSLNLAQKDLKLFSEVTSQLPYSFEFICFETKSVTSSKKRQIRDDFDKSKKHAFLQLLKCDPNATNQLLSMGLNTQQIDSFFSGKTVYDVDGKPLVVSVDHIHDINYGGTNDPRNLCIIPGYVNEIKDQFVRIQYRVDPNGKRKVTFAPRDGIKVPFVNTGFTVSLRHVVEDQRESVAENRYKEFLGLRH